MPIQLGTAPKEHGEPIDFCLIQKMVKYYRDNRLLDANSLKFVHIYLPELIQLLVDNSIIQDLPPIDKQRIKSYGVKIYMGNHALDSRTIPVGRSDYLDKNTAILCNTQLIPQGAYQTYTDLLDDGMFVTLPGIYTDMGLDKSTICPPDCPSATNHENMDIVDIVNPKC